MLKDFKLNCTQQATASAILPEQWATLAAARWQCQLLAAASLAATAAWIHRKSLLHFIWPSSMMVLQA
jgi:hypothetical protein